LLFKVISLGSFAAGFLSLLVRYWGKIDTLYYVPISILCIDYFICLFLLISSRFLAKSTYEFIISGVKRSGNVMIYGAGYSGLTTKNVLLNDKKKHYEILGFIDDNPSKINKTIEGLRVYSLEAALNKFMGSESPLEVILAINHLSTSERTKISDAFLERGVVVKTTPPLSKWVGGEFEINQIRKIKIEDLLSRDTISIDNKHISSEINNKTVLVTGAAGSIGSEIVKQLVPFYPAKIILVDQAESALYDLKFEIRNIIPENTIVQFVVADVTDRVRMRQIFDKARPHFVFHAAAYKHVPLMEDHPYEAIKVNVIGTKNIADLAAEMSVEKFVMVSTDKAVNPTNVMGATKRLAEMYTQSMNGVSGIETKYIATRFGNVLGSNGSVIPIFKKQIENGGPITVTHPEITRYFMTIPEACQLVLEAGTMGQGGEVFVFDMGESVKIVDLAKKMILLSGLQLGKDIQIEYSGLRPGEKLYEELLNDNENTLPTHHPKITIAKLVTPSYAAMEIALGEIERLLYEGTNRDLIATIKQLIPEYISNNSIYEALDEVKNKAQNDFYS
jgi:FlaA1/EpsC-like NDP-sugar epimerase